MNDETYPVWRSADNPPTNSSIVWLYHGELHLSLAEYVDGEWRGVNRQAIQHGATFHEPRAWTELEPPVRLPVQVWIDPNAPAGRIE